jgi:hypothetical protein
MLQEAAQQLVRLRTRQGATASLLRSLRAAADDLLDCEYSAHAAALAELCHRQAGACEALLQRHLPYLQALSHLNARYAPQQQQQQQEEEERREQQWEGGRGGSGAARWRRPGPGAADGDGAREAALAALVQVEPPVFDGDALGAAQWRYPPEHAVVWPVKGAARRPGSGGGLSAQPEPAARQRPLPPAQQQRAGAVRAGRRAGQGLFD